MERLDKILSNLGYGSRKELKGIIKKGNVKIDGVIVKDNGKIVDAEKSIIKINGEQIFYREFIYLIMNKPDGVISATRDSREETVIDLLHPDHQAFDPFPVGRLDKDTVGLLLLTNDGELNHKLIAPKWHVDKVYFARIDKKIPDSAVEDFEKGITIDDGYLCKPAKLEIMSATEDGSEIKLTIQEGKFHQVKRMFEAIDTQVTYLQRIEFGGLTLDSELEEGEYRELTDEELAILKSI
ncbi:pseudouridine synthase [Clostridium vincentii]|uniref:Pseudouridine synthase n=1 Tax=Clostridium vincentii TaxID=52704 RepID=A0A2T0B9X7_9CLOT|nr:pseudouridine synthase [Clostridium vincentii]PRR80706.1 Ribosomal large subunit pseudouridine synthase B [Clostridium vincentii]